MVVALISQVFDLMNWYILSLRGGVIAMPLALIFTEGTRLVIGYSKFLLLPNPLNTDNNAITFPSLVMSPSKPLPNDKLRLVFF